MLAASWGLVLWAVGSHAAGATPAAPIAADPAPGQPSAAGGDRVRMVVSFIEPAVAMQFAGPTNPGADLGRQKAMQDYAAALRSARQPRLDAIAALGAVVVSTMEHTANAAVVEFPAAHAVRLVEAVRRMPGVRGVQPLGIYRTDNSSSAAVQTR